MLVFGLSTLKSVAYIRAAFELLREQVMVTVTTMAAVAVVLLMVASVVPGPATPSKSGLHAFPISPSQPSHALTFAPTPRVFIHADAPTRYVAPVSATAAPLMPTAAAAASLVRLETKDRPLLTSVHSQLQLFPSLCAVAAYGNCGGGSTASSSSSKQPVTTDGGTPSPSHSWTASVTPSSSYKPVTTDGGTPSPSRSPPASSSPNPTEIAPGGPCGPDNGGAKYVQCRLILHECTDARGVVVMIASP